MSDSHIQAKQAGNEHERQPDRDSRSLTAKEWAPLADSGATTYTVGQPASCIGVFADRSEAEALADEHGGTFIEWTGAPATWSRPPYTTWGWKRGDPPATPPHFNRRDRRGYDPAAPPDAGYAETEAGG